MCQSTFVDRGAVMDMDGDIVINLGQLCKESMMFSLHMHRRKWGGEEAQVHTTVE